MMDLYYYIYFLNIAFIWNMPLFSFPLSDGSFLAVGSHDNFIYIYNVTESGRRYSRYGKCNVSCRAVLGCWGWLWIIYVMNE